MDLLLHKHLGITGSSNGDEPRVEELKDPVADLGELRLDLRSVVLDRRDVVVVAAALLLLLDRRDDAPRGTASADHVLVSDGEEIALLDGELAVDGGGEFLHELYHLLVPLGLLRELGHIGNPLLELGRDTSATYEFFWSHGTISDETRGTIITHSDFSNLHNQSKVCSDALKEADTINGYVNNYDVLLHVCYPSIVKQELRLKQMATKMSMGVDVCMTYERKFYFNLPEVQQDLHANRTHLPYQWSMCSSLVYVLLLRIVLLMVHVTKMKICFVFVLKRSM
ncbi:hypothetical protein Bca4012_057120 [Brassica carinata]